MATPKKETQPPSSSKPNPQSHKDLADKGKPVIDTPAPGLELDKPR